MHPKAIIAKLYECEHPPGIIARDLGVTRPTVSEVIHNKQHSYNVATYISAVTGLPLNTLWPDTYTFPLKKPISHPFKSQFKHLEAA